MLWNTSFTIYINTINKIYVSNIENNLNDIFRFDYLYMYKNSRYIFYFKTYILDKIIGS